MKPIISVEGLGKKYVIRHEGQTHYKSLREEIFQLPKKLFRRQDNKEEFWALKDVSFDIMPGDRVGIIGRNGAGKSTLLKLLSRITEPSAGRIAMRGRVASLLEVGTGFHPELTGRENIYLNGAILGMSRSEVRRKFDEIVEFSGVEKFLDTPVKRYSSGMYVRLAFAVAAHLEPEILIVDEVLAVGDAEFQKKCLGKMEEVGKEGRTVLFVSHNMSTIHSLCNFAYLLRDGMIDHHGLVASVIKQYINASKAVEVKGEVVRSLVCLDVNGESCSSFNEFPSKLRLDMARPLTLDYDSYILISINNDHGRILFFDTRKYIHQRHCNVSSLEFCFHNHVVLAFGTYSINVACFLKGVMVEHIPSVRFFEVVSMHSREDTCTDFSVKTTLRLG